MDRLPPGQRWVSNVPVLHHGEIPVIEPANWSFFAAGPVKNPFVLDWDCFKSLPMKKMVRDFHCVTRWSVMDIEWEGVPFAEVIRLAAPEPSARFVIIHSYGGFTTNLPIEIASREDNLFAVSMYNEPLLKEHGFPMRLVVPVRYAWKSAKWVRGVEFSAKDRPGFWETNGYHNNGDPWEEERYSGL